MNTKLACRLTKPARSPYYQIRWTLPGGKEQAKSTGLRDKRAAESYMEEFIREYEHVALGLLPPKRVREAAAADFLTLAEGYLNDLRAQKCAPLHVENTGRNIRILSQYCGWKCVRNVTPESFCKWRARQADTKAPKTLNEYLTSIRAFLNWLVQCDLIPENPLRKVARVKQFEKRRNRRAITDAQAAVLLSVAPKDRRLVYLVAMHTGLRRNEMESLQWRDLHLDCENPFIKLRAATTKNRKADTVFIHPELWTALIEARPEGFDSQAPVLSMPRRLNDFRKDLEAAGIPFIDQDGLRFDLHAMRMTFNMRMANGNVPTRIAMQAMRHSEERLTTKVYTDAARLPVAAHVNALPALLPLEVSRIVSGKFGPIGHSPTQADTFNDSLEPTESVQNQPFEPALTHSATHGQGKEIGSDTRART